MTDATAAAPDLPTVLGSYVTEALQLRLGVDTSRSGVAPALTLEHLQDVRRRLDRVEELLTRGIRVRARAQRAAAAAQAAVDDAWDAAIRKVRAAPVQAGGEYSSARERHAEANLAVLDLRHAARRAHETAHHCEEAVEVIRVAHRGLDGVRGDALAVLRTLAFESHLER